MPRKKLIYTSRELHQAKLELMKKLKAEKAYEADSKAQPSPQSEAVKTFSLRGSSDSNDNIELYSEPDNYFLDWLY